MEIISDLHLHSKYSRAVSKNMDLALINKWAELKGIDLVSTSDWTHPLWIKEIKNKLTETREGIYKLNKESKTAFLLSTEISCIYKLGNKTRKIHLLVLSPSLKISEKINSYLSKYGFNITSDGRPILGISAHELVKIILDISSKCLVIPAHIWTPYFSLYGAFSGFDSLEECFGEESKNIYAVETGLSSDPEMNWRVEDLGKRKLVSFSDAHSVQKLGRETTVFNVKNKEFSYSDIYQAITTPDNSSICFTTEFYPQEGKYHYTGHEACSVVYSPGDVVKKGSICPVCGKPLTFGVASRVLQLSTEIPEIKINTDKLGINWIYEAKSARPPYVMLVPLLEIIKAVFGIKSISKRVELEYQRLTKTLGSEFQILLKSHRKEIEEVGGERLAEAVQRVREGKIHISPGYDGVFGKVTIFV